MAGSCSVGSGISLLIAASLTLILKPLQVSAQSLDAKLATYILAGIAGVYTLLTCFCFLVAVCICCNKCSRKSTKKHPYIEEVESPIELHGTVFENKYYVQEDVKKDQDTDTIKAGIDKNATIFVNDCAYIDQIKKEHGQKLRESPLARHKPKIITHPVRVPYSDDTPNVNESEPESAPLSKRTTLSRSIHVDGHSPFELKSLKRREKFGRETTDTFHSPVNDASKGASLQKNRLEMENHNSTCTPKTSPLPRSGLTKITDSTNEVTLTKLCAELSSVAPKWYDVGIQLKISHKTLTAIRAINKKNNEICMMRVCEEWLLQEKKCNRVPTWSMIIEILKSKVISETALARLMDQKYCDKTGEETDGEGEPTSKSYTWL